MRRALALALAALAPGAASAHRLDELAQAAYLTLAPGEVRLELDLAPGMAVAEAMIAALDADADGAIGEAEARAFARHMLDLAPLVLNGAPAPWTLGRVSVPDVAALRAGSEVLRVDAAAVRPDTDGAHDLTFEATYDAVPSLWMVNVFLKPGPGWAYAVTGQSRSDDGRRLTVSYDSGPG